MSEPLQMKELQARMIKAQERLALERLAIGKLHPLHEGVDRETYVEAYVRAEHFGLKTINRKLADLKDLPLRLDPETEMLGDNYEPLHYWLMGEGEKQPSSRDFGNDFMHAIARAALVYGWQDIRTAQVAGRIAQLFSDLSCVIGIVYYSSYLVDKNVQQVPVSNPDDLKNTVKEVAQIASAGELRPIFPATEQINVSHKKGGKNKRPSHLHLVSDKTTLDSPKLN